MQTVPIKQGVQTQPQQPAAPVSNGLSAHKATKLVSLDSMAPEPDLLSLAVFGDGGVGKTRFLCSMPGDVGVIPLNSKCRRRVQEVAPVLYPGKRFWFPENDLIRHANPMALAMMMPRCKEEARAFKAVPVGIDPPQCCAQHFYQWHGNRVKDAVWTMLNNPAIKSIAIDDGTQMYMDFTYAHYGRAYRFSENPTSYAPINSDMTDLINAVKYKKHLLIIHKAKEEYKANVRTGKDTLDGMKGIKFEVSTLAEMGRDQKTGDFFLSVNNCNDNASLFGGDGNRLLVNEDIDFAHLAAKVFGEEKFVEYLEQCM